MTARAPSGAPGPPPRPLIAIATSMGKLEGPKLPAHYAPGRYIDSAVEFSDCVPLLLPGLGGDTDTDAITARIDGLLLTGGRANIEPHHYGGPPFPEDEIRDPGRDATVLPLIRACVEAGVPIFGICRGIQEINVALGGTLHYRIHLLPGKMDHRMVRDVSPEETHALRHTVSLTEGGLFAALLDGGGGTDAIGVNTLHGQGIDRLAPGLKVEAVSPDGVIEGLSAADGAGFVAGVQWHAEWKPGGHALSAALYRAFGEAARARAEARAGGPMHLKASA